MIKTIERGRNIEDIEVQNTSGHGEFSVIPAEIKKWNWGAFWLTWIWGIGNHSYLALLTLLPILNLIMPFYLGAKGNELAWRNATWYNLEDFKMTQRKWSLWGWGIAGVILFISILTIVQDYKSEKQSIEIGNRVMSYLKADDKAKELLGDNYNILSNMSILKVGTNSGMQPVSGMLIIQAKDQIVWVSVELDKDYTIKKITVSPSDEKQPPKKEIVIYP